MVRVKAAPRKVVEGKALFAFRAEKPGELDLPEDTNVEVLEVDDQQDEKIAKAEAKFRELDDQVGCLVFHRWLRSSLTHSLPQLDRCMLGISPTIQPVRMSPSTVDCGDMLCFHSSHTGVRTHAHHGSTGKLGPAHITACMEAGSVLPPEDAEGDEPGSAMAQVFATYVIRLLAYL